MKKLTTLLLTILIAGAAMKTMREKVQEQRNRKAIEAIFDRQVRPRHERLRLPRSDRPATGARARYEAQQRRR